MFFIAINIEKFEIRPRKILGTLFIFTKFKCVIFCPKARLGLFEPTCNFFSSTFYKKKGPSSLTFTFICLNLEHPIAEEFQSIHWWDIVWRWKVKVYQRENEGEG